jgi:2-C-methyl-D-erythritol 4-phosphate cytidylyltransferase
MVSAIIVAAGRGVRMGGSIPKQYLLLGNFPVVSHSLMAFDDCRAIDRLYLVVPEPDVDYCARKILRPLRLAKPVQLVPGGAQRQLSVYNGLCRIEHKQGMVLIHDGVRPFVDPDHIRSCLEGAGETGACIPAVPVTETLKNVSSAGVIENTIDREGIWQAQTPQAFSYDVIMKAHAKARKDGFLASDDALLVERLGEKVRVIAGNKDNLKITTPEDLQTARAILAFRRAVDKSK